jgi:uncharacterized protein (TIGR01319 family)
MSDYDLQSIITLKPNIILIAGGVDYGETLTTLENAKKIASLRLNTPVIYAGNIQNRQAIHTIFANHGQDRFLSIAPNVYPRIDHLDVTETRKIIQRVFEENITKAPGMEKVRSIISDHIIPVPGAVMEATQLLYREIGDLVTVDIGGATTDVHSVTEGSEEIRRKMIAPEPLAKRTVEGDLGLFINKKSLVNAIGQERLCKELGLNETDMNNLLSNLKTIPTKEQLHLTERMTYHALSLSMHRHCGKTFSIYGTNGMTKLAEGKDLTTVKYLVGTGGALTRLPHRKELIEEYLNEIEDWSLKPGKTTRILIDSQYIMATLGVLSLKYPETAKMLLKSSLGL